MPDQNAFDRRDFLRKMGELAGGTAAVAVLLPIAGGTAGALGGASESQVVPKDDARLVTEYVKYPVEGGEMRAYMARLKEGGKRPAVIVIHENRGLNPHTEDVARRLALEGYIADRKSVV